MSTRAGGVRIPITADAKGVGDGVRDAERALERLNKSGSRTFSALKFGAAGAAVALGGGFVAALRSGVDGMMEADKAAAQLDAVLKSTGNTAGLTREQMVRMADSMERSTGIASETTQQAQGLLATFSQIGKETFPAATRAAVDMSVAFDQSAKSSAIQLGKALQDPVKGVTALQRIGVSFTEQQREQIKVLVESNRTQEAQALILREVNKQVQGSAAAYGQTLPGQLARAQHAWGEITEELTRKLLPALTATLAWVLRNMPRFQAAIDSVVKFVTAIIRQDWATAWAYARTVLDAALKGIVAALRALGPWLGRAARDAGVAIARGIWAGFESALVGIPGSGALRRVLGMSSGDVGPPPAGGGRSMFDFGAGPAIPGVRRAAGGYVPGPRGAGDVVPAMLTPGEVVLNERQQRLLGTDRIMGILAATGGVLGGRFFNRGGVVEAARQRAVSNLGEPYGKPSRGESRTGPNSWDCSGYATMIAGVNVGGTTASAYQSSTGVRDHSRYPIVWGFRKSHGGTYRGGYDEHMGVRVGGVWYQTSGGRTAQTGSDGSWQEIRVPRGLERLTDADAGGAMDLSVSTGGGGGGLSRAAFGRVVGALRRGGGASSPGLTDVPSITRRHADDALQEREILAKSGGKRSAVIQSQIDELNQDVADLTTQMKRLRKRRGEIDRERRKLIREAMNPRTRPARRAQIRDRLSALNDERTAVVDALNTLAAERDDVIRQGKILGFDLTDAQREENTPQDTGGGIEAPALSAVDILNANTNALNSAFFRTAFGAGDIGTGGPGALAASGGGRWVNLRVESGSLAGAVASSSGDQGYVSVTTVPAGV